MNKKLIAGLVTGAVVLVGGFAVAGNEMADRHAERARQFITWKLDDALDDLDATDAQRATAMKLKDQLVDEGLRIKATHEEVRAGLLAQWKADRVDATRVHALVDEMVDGIRGFAHKLADAGITLHDTLSPEQRAKVEKKVEQSHSRWNR